MIWRPSSMKSIGGGVCKFLLETGQQVLLTGVEEKPLLAACKNQYGRLFHVKHGEVEAQGALNDR